MNFIAEDLQLFLFIITMGCVLKAASEAYIVSNKLRKCDTYEKTIYNYRGKTQDQVYAILELEVAHELPNREIVAFSNPIFKDDGSVEYIVYLKPQNRI